MEPIDFAALIGHRVRAVSVIEPSFAGHGSDIWRVEAAGGPVIVRRSRERPPGRNAFFATLHRLFGITPWDAASVAATYAALAPFAPRVLRCRPPFLVMEHLPGRAPASFAGLGGALGDRLGRIHSRRYARWGHPVGRARLALREFHPRLATAMADAAARHWPRHALLQRVLPGVLAGLRRVPPPEEACLCMADLDAGQFLVDGERLLGPIDVEAYVLAPPALELACLEYQIGVADALAFRQAYRRHRPLPVLGPLRPAYRLFHYVIRFLLRGPDLSGWSGRRALFP